MWRWWRAGIGVVGALLHAALASAAGVPNAPPRSPSAILIDAASGETLLAQDADAVHPTAGLDQLMVLLLSIEQAEMNALPLAAAVSVSPLAAGLCRPPARIPLSAGKRYLLGDLLKAMAVSAAPDAEGAVAEAIAGSLPACLELMNVRAQRLGMTSTHYEALAGGSPESAPDPGATTARDVARLAQALLRHSPVLQWASLSGLPFDHGAILLRNANQLLGAVPGVDGLLVASRGDSGERPAVRRGVMRRPAAGHTMPSRTATGRRAGFDMVATAQRQSLRLIAVVLDAPDSVTRYNKAVELLEWGFARYETLDVVKDGDRLNLEVRVVNGVETELTPVAGQAVSLLRRRDEERDLQVRYQVPSFVTAPIKRRQVIGELVVEERGALVAVVPVVSPRSVAASSVFSTALQ
jgi:D-alanyl-D-alanine carboxypeptidase (penicillin-binding protein 5/6)